MVHVLIYVLKMPFSYLVREIFFENDKLGMFYSNRRSPIMVICMSIPKLIVTFLAVSFFSKAYAEPIYGLIAPNGNQSVITLFSEPGMYYGSCKTDCKVGYPEVYTALELLEDVRIPPPPGSPYTTDQYFKVKTLDGKIGYVHGSHVDTMEQDLSGLKCTAHKSLTGEAAKIVTTFVGGIGQRAQTLRPLNELEAWMERFRGGCRDTDLEKYYTEYKGYIELAAEEFDLPVQFLTCVLFKESKFDKNAESHTGAEGLGQFIDDTQATVDTIVGRVKTSEAKRDEHRELLDRLIEKRKTDRLSEQEQKDLTFISSRVQQYDLADRWESYFKKAESRFGISEKYDQPVVPERFTRRGVDTPPNAIGASALYLRYLMDKVSNRIDAPKEDKNMLLAAAASYNRGAGKIIPRINEVDPSKWVEVMSYEPEVTSYLGSMQNCLEPGGTDGPVLVGGKIDQGCALTNPYRGQRQ
jgi:soluble lytic murein transglycosylase-like protein